MKPRIIFITIFCLIVISFISPLLLPSQAQGYISSVANIITVVSTLLTLGLAMILFNQIGLDQTLLQKKAKVVFQVMDLLSKRSFHIETAQGRIMIFLTTINHRKEGYERFGDIRLLFNKKYLDAIAPLIELRQNVFLPKDLSDKLLRLEAEIG